MVGNESQVEKELRAFASAGATDSMCAVMPVGEDARSSENRTQEHLGSLVGKT